MNDEISKSLDLPPLPEAVLQHNVEVQKDGDLNYDYEFARANIINTIEKGNEALNGILDVADQSQHPRSYEVAANLIKTMVEANKDLIELTKKKRDIDNNSGTKPTTVNNNLFVGSTAELQKLIKQQNEPE